MADNLLRLKVDSQEYDAKIKRAAEGIQHFVQNIRESGSNMKESGILARAFLQELGNMETVANGTKQQLREMSNAITTLTQTYRELSDEEKRSGFGQELNKQIQILTERAGKAKDAMMDVEASIRNAASDTRMFDQLSQGASVMTAGFQGLIGAGKMLGIEMGNDVEVIAKLQAAMAVTNSLTTIQTALQKQSALMQGVQAAQTAIASAAQRVFAAVTGDATKAQAAFNAVSKANPYLLLASAVAAVGSALLAFSNNAKKAKDATEQQTEAMKQAQRMADIWKSTMGSTYSSLMTKYDELKRQWQSLSSEHSKTDWIKKNQTALHDLGGAVNDVKSAEDFFNNNTDAVVQSFVRRAQAAARVAQLTELYRKQIELLDKKSQASAAITADAQNSGRSAKAGDIIEDKTYRSSKYGKVNAQGNWVFTEQGAKLYSGTDTSSASSVMKIDVEIEANQSEIEKVKNQITNEFKDISVVGGGTGGKDGKPTNTITEEKDDFVEVNGLINMATERVNDLQKRIREAPTESIITELRDQLKDAQAELDRLTGKLNGDGAPTFTMAQLEGISFDNQIPTIRGNNGRAQDKLDLATAAFATGGISNIDFSTYISGIKNALSNANLGDELYKSMTEKLKDATTVSTLLQEMMERGLAGADLETTAQALKEKLLSPEGIDQTAIQSFLEGLNAQIEEAGGIGLKLNADTGEVTDDKGKGKDKGDGEDLKKFNEGIGKLSGGLSQLTGGLKAVGVELPEEVDQVIGVINGVSQIISGVGTIISIFGTTAITANTTAVGLNTATMAGLIAALEFNSATNFFGLANGGIVPAFAHGGLIGRAAGGMMIPGNSMSGDRLRLPVDGGRGMIGVNSGELILNKSSQNSLAASLLQAESLIGSIKDYSVSLGNAQQTILAQELEGGGMQNLKLDTIIRGEDIRLVLNNNGRRTNRGEYVQTNRR